MTGIVVELHDRKPSVTRKIFLPHSTRLRSSTSNSCSLAAGFPITISSHSAKSSALCSAERRVQTHHRLPPHRRGPDGAASGRHLRSSARSKRSPEDQASEFRVLDYLAACVSDSDDGSENRVDGTHFAVARLTMSRTGRARLQRCR